MYISIQTYKTLGWFQSELTDFLWINHFIWRGEIQFQVRFLVCIKFKYKILYSSKDIISLWIWQKEISRIIPGLFQNLLLNKIILLLYLYMSIHINKIPTQQRKKNRKIGGFETCNPWYLKWSNLNWCRIWFFLF